MKNIEKRNNVMLIIRGGKTTKKIRCDSAIRQMLYILNLYGIHTVGSCVGHNRYPLSIVYKTYHSGVETFYELVSGVKIPRTRNFYKMDSNGFYYIPETIEKG